MRDQSGTDADQTASGNLSGPELSLMGWARWPQLRGEDRPLSDRRSSGPSRSDRRSPDRTSSVFGAPGEPSVSDFLTAARERVVIYDGAMGTGIQAAGLTADDFGGPDLEGCNELLVRHPARRSSRRLHARLPRRRRRRRRDRQRSAASALTLAEYGIAERAHELNVAAARIAREVAPTTPTPRPPPLGGRLDRARHQVPLARPDPLRRAARPVRGARPAACSRAASTCSSSRPAVRPARQSRPAMNGCPPGHGGEVGREVPIQVQVTMELTGRDAARHRDRRRPRRARRR